MLEKISSQLPDLLVQVVETGKSINQVLKSNLSEDNQQELRFILVKLEDGCSVTVRNIISNADLTKQICQGGFSRRSSVQDKNKQNLPIYNFLLFLSPLPKLGEGLGVRAGSSRICHLNLLPP